MSESNNLMLPLEAIYLAMVEKYNVEILEKETNTIHRGRVLGFDEYMNIVLDTGNSRYILKGDCISQIMIK